MHQLVWCCSGVFTKVNSALPLFRGGLPWWLSGEEHTCQYRRRGFDPWVGKISWRRKWQPTPVFLPGESYGQKEPGGVQSKRSPRVRHGLVDNNNSSGEAHILEGEDYIYSQATDVASARSRAVVTLGGQGRMCRDHGVHGTFMTFVCGFLLPVLLAESFSFS